VTVNIGQTFLHDTKNRGFHFLGQAAQVRRHIEFDSQGDVIDIGLLRTTLMETGNWVSKDLYNGRINMLWLATSPWNATYLDV
jgi:hypothetical protein